MANVQNLVPFSPGDDPRRNKVGRPKKWVTLLKEEGYKQSEIYDAIKVMLAFTEAELNDVFSDSNSTALDRTIAKAILNSMKKGSLFNIETLITRVYGSPKETVESNNTVNMTAPLNVVVNNTGIPLMREEDESVIPEEKRQK